MFIRREIQSNQTLEFNVQETTFTYMKPGINLVIYKFNRSKRRKPSGSRVWKQGSMSFGSEAKAVEILALTAADRFRQSAGILFRSTNHS